MTFEKLHDPRSSRSARCLATGYEMGIRLSALPLLEQTSNWEAMEKEIAELQELAQIETTLGCGVPYEFGHDFQLLSEAVRDRDVARLSFALDRITDPLGSRLLERHRERAHERHEELLKAA